MKVFNGNKLKDLKVNILSPNGLKSLKVTIKAGNEDFQAAVEDLNFTNRELVGDTELEGILMGVGVNIAMPKADATSYDFPIGAFFPMMNIYGATDAGKYHEFIITATDNTDNKEKTVTKSLKVTINE